MLELLYHKRNPLIMTLIDGSIFLKILRLPRARVLEEKVIFAQVLNDEIIINAKNTIFIQMKSFLNYFLSKKFC